MSAEKPLIIQIADHRKMWQELWWNMAEGDITGYREIKKLDVFEFWGFFDKWRERNQKESDRLRQQQNTKR